MFRKLLEIKKNNDRIEQHELQIKIQNASIKNLEMQIRQITNLLGGRNQRTFSSDTKNPREQAKATTLRSGK